MLYEVHVPEPLLDVSGQVVEKLWVQAEGDDCDVEINAALAADVADRASGGDGTVPDAVARPAPVRELFLAIVVIVALSWVLSMLN